MGQKKISIIMPVYNEEENIAVCLESLMNQTFDMRNVEFIVVDGLSDDETLSIIEEHKNQLNIRVILNEERKTPCAMNIGIDNSHGDYIIRLDAHAEYDSQYIEKCIYYLDTIDADNVGGVATTKGHGLFGNINADILSSKFGVGGSKFRTGAKSGYVDTVPFGAFRREVFSRIGKYNTDLTRSEDNDINSRIRQSGGKVYLASDIKFIYYCRDSLRGLLEMALGNGNALFFTRKRNAKAMSVRHYIPMAFVTSLITLTICSFVWPIAKYILMAEMIAYAILDTYFSLFEGRKRYFLFKLLVYPLFHFVYGLGSLLGLFSIKLY